MGKFYHGGNGGKLEAKDCFKKGNSDGIKFTGFGSSFTLNFLQKVESSVPAGEIKAHKLLRGSKDPGLITALGNSHETYLGDLYVLLTQQPKGEDGLLLTNGYANIFYIRDAKGILWAVNADWRDVGWYVDAYSLGNPDDWRADRQVFSR